MSLHPLLNEMKMIIVMITILVNQSCTKSLWHSNLIGSLRFLRFLYFLPLQSMHRLHLLLLLCGYLASLSWFQLPQLFCNATNVTATVSSENDGLLNEFRTHYSQFNTLLAGLHTQQMDFLLTQQLNQDLNEFSTLVESVSSNI